MTDHTVTPVATASARPPVGPGYGPKIACPRRRSVVPGEGRRRRRRGSDRDRPATAAPPPRRRTNPRRRGGRRRRLGVGPVVDRERQTGGEAVRAGRAGGGGRCRPGRSRRRGTAHPPGCAGDRTRKGAAGRFVPGPAGSRRADRPPAAHRSAGGAGRHASGVGRGPGRTRGNPGAGPAGQRRPPGTDAGGRQLLRRHRGRGGRPAQGHRPSRRPDHAHRRRPARRALGLSPGAHLGPARLHPHRHRPGQPADLPAATGGRSTRFTVAGPAGAGSCGARSRGAGRLRCVPRAAGGDQLLRRGAADPRGRGGAAAVPGQGGQGHRDRGPARCLRGVLRDRGPPVHQPGHQTSGPAGALHADLAAPG